MIHKHVSSAKERVKDRVLKHTSDTSTLGSTMQLVSKSVRGAHELTRGIIDETWSANTTAEEFNFAEAKVSDTPRLEGTSNSDTVSPLKLIKPQVPMFPRELLASKSASQSASQSSTPRSQVTLQAPVVTDKSEAAIVVGETATAINHNKSATMGELGSSGAPEASGEASTNIGTKSSATSGATVGADTRISEAGTSGAGEASASAKTSAKVSTKSSTTSDIAGDGPVGPIGPYKLSRTGPSRSHWDCENPRQVFISSTLPKIIAAKTSQPANWGHEKVQFHGHCRLE